MRSTFAAVNLKQLKKNFLNIRKKTLNKKILAVVKADAYGHGAKEIILALNSLGKNKPDYYGVAFVQEAIQLRELNITQPVLVFSPPEKNDSELFFKYNLLPTVFEAGHLQVLKRAGGKMNRKKIKLHVKINTGMNRLGVHYSDAFDFIKKLSANPFFEIDGVYTHFATADKKNKQFANVQLKRFNGVLAQLKSEGIKTGLIHAANSGAILDMPESYFDMVRAGILMYGYYPSLETSESVKVKPVLSLYSTVSTVGEIYPSDSVSYGRKFISTCKTNIISVPIGYADGYNRNLSNKGKCIIKDKVYKQIGTVTMDRIMFNTGDDKLQPGGKVILIGQSKSNEISAWDLAKTLNTIPYEILCNISKRVQRLYIN